MITLNCPHCGQKFQSSTSLRAAIMDCTTCHQQFEIPELKIGPIEPPRALSLPALSSFEGSPGGVGRGSYFFINLFLVIFVFISEIALYSKVQEGLKHEAVLVLKLVIVLMAGITSILIFRARLINMSVSTWWTLIIFIPLVNTIAAIGLVGYPTRYGVNKKVDSLGKVIFIVLPFAVIGILLIIREIGIGMV